MQNFATVSDDGSQLAIGHSTVVDIQGTSDLTRERWGGGGKCQVLPTSVINQIVSVFVCV